MDFELGPGAGRKGLDVDAGLGAQMVEQAFRQYRTRRIACAKDQDVEAGIRHAHKSYRHGTLASSRFGHRPAEQPVRMPCTLPNALMCQAYYSRGPHHPAGASKSARISILHVSGTRTRARSRATGNGCLRLSGQDQRFVFSAREPDRRDGGSDAASVRQIAGSSGCPAQRPASRRGCAR